MGIEENKEIVREYFRRFDSGDIRGSLDLLAEDCVWTIPGDLPVSGRKTKADFVAICDLMEEVFDGPLRFVANAMTAEGERVAVEAVSWAKTQRGRDYRNHYHLVFIVRDGLIRAVGEYMDTQHWLTVHGP